MATKTRQDAPPHDDADQFPPAEGGSQGFNQFLKSEHINESGTTRFDLTGYVRTSVGQYGPQVVLEVEDADGKTWDFGVKEGSPNHRMLWRALGGDTRTWGGSIVVKRDRFKLSNTKWSNWSISIVEVIARQGRR